MLVPTKSHTFCKCIDDSPWEQPAPGQWAQQWTNMSHRSSLWESVLWNSGEVDAIETSPIICLPDHMRLIQMSYYIKVWCGVSTINPSHLDLALRAITYLTGIVICCWGEFFKVLLCCRVQNKGHVGRSAIQKPGKWEMPWRKRKHNDLPTMMHLQLPHVLESAREPGNIKWQEGIGLNRTQMTFLQRL